MSTVDGLDALDGRRVREAIDERATKVRVLHVVLLEPLVAVLVAGMEWNGMAWNGMEWNGN